MKQIVHNLLVRINIRPFKTVKLRTGIIVEHYRNGNLNVI
jgi:hypothetical protein